MRDQKAQATLNPLRADVSRQFNRCCIKKSSMASCFTSLLPDKSDLLPMRVTHMEASAYCWISFSQLGKFSKVLARVRSNTITAPTVFLQQLEAIARKRSCPAVSQIWLWMVLPSMCTTLVDSSTPMVALELSWKELLRYLESRLVLPTPESPTMTSLKRQSISSLDMRSQSDQN